MERQSVPESQFERWPLFSTADKGSRMTALPEGHPIGRTAPLLPGLVLAALAWGLSGTVLFGGLLGLAPTPEASIVLGHPISVAISIVMLLIAIGLTVRLATGAVEQFGQSRVASLFVMVTVLGGLAASAATLLLWTLASNPSYRFSFEPIATSPTIPLELGILVGAGAALWAAIALLRLRGAIAHARGRQRDIERLRSEGSPLSGTLSAVTFSNQWRFRQPLFLTEISYELGASPRSVTARMRTDADQVPLVGSPMIVLADDHGTVYVELERTSDVRFDENESKYAPSDG